MCVLLFYLFNLAFCFSLLRHWLSLGTNMVFLSLWMFWLCERKFIDKFPVPLALFLPLSFSRFNSLTLAHIPFSVYFFLFFFACYIYYVINPLVLWIVYFIFIILLFFLIFYNVFAVTAFRWFSLSLSLSLFLPLIPYCWWGSCACDQPRVQNIHYYISY